MKYPYSIILLALVAGVACQGIYEMVAQENAHKNLALSPFSIETVLSLAYMGAEGRTKQELRQALRLPENKQEVARKYKGLMKKLQGREQPPREAAILKLANRIFVNNGYSLRPEFNRAVWESFKAVAQPIDLASGGDKAANLINQWILNQTDGRIKNIVPPASLHPGVRAILVNALYLKGDWYKQFPPSNTKNGDFHLTSQRRISVPMMTQSEGFRAGDFPDLQAKVLELPYANSNLVMVIFLPYAVDGLSALEEKIAGFSRPLENAFVNVKLPKFRIEFDISLKSTLQKMGIRDLFTVNSDLSGLLTGNVEAPVEDVKHKAFVEVDENGTEAAGASYVGIAFMSEKYYELYMDFIADHPFAFIIRDPENIYFQGHVVEPHKIN